MSFARRYARTQRFTLGLPRDITVCAGGDRILFLRAAGPEDPLTELWRWTPDGERRLLSPRDHLPRGGAELSDAERARRERQRESAAGITAYATDRAGILSVISLGGEVLVVDTETGEVATQPTGGNAFDPRLSPSGDHLAWVIDGAVEVAQRGGLPRTLVREEGVSWGVADFVAAEEMHRFRGFWWSPDGARIAACRVDERRVETWFITDPGEPGSAPRPHRYPAAGTANPDVQLAVFDINGDGRVDVEWDRDSFPYLARVNWRPGHPLTLLVQDRSQRTWRILTVDEGTGATSVVREDHDPTWLELVPGIPAWTSDGRLVSVRDLPEHGAGGSRAVLVDGSPVTPAGLQVESVIEVSNGTIWFHAFPGPFDTALYALDLASGEVDRLTGGEGVHEGAARDGTVVVHASGVDTAPTVGIHRAGTRVGAIQVGVANPEVTPVPRFLRLGRRQLPSVLLLPTDRVPDGLPLLLAPYGGPGIARARRAVRSRRLLLEAQWFADQGFAVLVVDNRGMPGVNVDFEKSVAGDLASLALEDQVSAVEALASEEPTLDFERVAIRGWSFGGFLSALAVLRRPDVFTAGIVGAPVADWRLYDTHYTERYLGSPDERPDAYRRSSLVDTDGELVDPQPWSDRHRLLIIHGLADDNVVAAHSLRLSAALFAAGRRHEFLPLSGVTHMTPQEIVTERLFEVQLRFLRESLEPA